MVPQVKFYLVGGYLRDDSPRHDVDIVGVLPERVFQLTFGYNHGELMQAYKEESRPDKLERYLTCNKVTGWLLSQLFPKYVDFKWILPSMLYKPNSELFMEADVTSYL